MEQGLTHFPDDRRIQQLGKQLLELCEDGCTAEVGVFKSLLEMGADPNIQDRLYPGYHPLWYASRYGNRDLVELFLQYKADVNLKAEFIKETALHAACKHGHMDVASSLLHHGAVVVDSQAWDGQTALRLASRSGRTDVVKLLVDSGAQIDNKDKDGWTALHRASSSGHTDVVKLLVESGAQIDNKDKVGQTALHLASSSGHTDVVKLLADSGAQIDNKDKDGRTALRHASSSGLTDVVKLLVDSGAQIDNKDKGGRTALHRASSSGHTDVVKLLVDSGAQIDNKDKNFQTALHLASISGHTGVVKLLVDADAQVDNKDKDGQTALHHASSSGHTDVVKLLADSGAQIDNKDKDGQSALYLALYNNHTDVVKVLLASGAQPDIKYWSEKLLKLCKDGCTAEVGVFKSLLDQGVDPNIRDDKYGSHPLWYASRYGKRDLVELFLQYKADVNLKTKYGEETALHAACEHGHVDIASLLLHHGAVVDSQVMDGQTALHHASNSGHTDVVKLLVDSGAQIDNKDKDGWTALDLGSKKDHTDVVKVLLASGAHHGMKYLGQQGQQLLNLCKDGCTAEVGAFKSLLDQGVDPNIQDEDGLHPLWYATCYGKRDLVELFLQYKADVNLKTTFKDGWTPLHRASSSGHTDVVKLLVDSGADIDNKDKDGWTALDLGSKKDHLDVVKVLLASGAHHGINYLCQQLLKLCKDGCTAEVGAFKSLLDQGADPNIQDDSWDGYHSLWYASRYGNRDLVELFLQYKADVNLKTKHGQTALQHASSSGHTDVVKLLIDSGAQINNKDKDGWTTLDLASNNDHTDVVKVLLASGAHHGIKYLCQQLLNLCKDGCTAEVGVFKSLLDQGADPNILDDKDGRHPLWYASRYGNRDLVELFLQYKADVNLKTKNGETALLAACKNEHVDVATLLLQHGAVVDSQDKYGRTALHHASSSGHTDVVKLLVDSGAQIDNKDKYGRTALHRASNSGHTDMVKLLVDSGAHIDNKVKDGWTVLDLASNNDHTDVVKVLLASGANHGIKYFGQQLLNLCKDGCTAEVRVFKSLLDQGADPNIQDDKDGYYPLWYACRYGKRDLIELFLQYKADVNLKTNISQTALHYASSSGHTDAVKLLVDSGAEIDRKDNIGRTALHHASSSGHTNVVKLLVNSGAEIDIKHKDGRTALHRASSSGHTDVVKLLLDSGAKIDIKENYGKTPLDQAKNYGRSEVVSLLEKEAVTRSSKTEEPSSIDDNESERDKPLDDVDPAASDSDDISSEKVLNKDEVRSKSPAPSGQILLKHELVALAKLLAAYSDEKLKEIKQNLQKKQGGDISREEVERSLRENGLTSIADDLKENLEKSVEDQQHYEAYESALKGGLALTMQYLKFLFFGPPRTGKSTARRRLIQEIVNLDSLGEPSASTGVAEANDVIIKKLTSEPAAISGSQWWSIKKSKEDGQIDEGDCDYLAQLFYRLISKTMSETEQTTTVPATIGEPASSISERESKESDIVETTDVKEASSPPKSPKLQDHSKKDLLAEFQAELSSVPLSNSEEKEIDEAFKKLTSTLQSDSPEELRKLLEDLTMLNMVDIGGQSAFLELCPAFTTGPALYFIFFRLDQELKKKYQIKYQSADGEETILESSYCTETVIHQTLSSIACFERRSTAVSAKSAPSSIVSGHALLVGTYKDQVDDERISQMNTALRQQLEHTKLYKEDLLLQASEDTLFYSLNNMTGDDSEMSPIRKDIEKIIKNMFSKVDIPASWLMFRIILHFLHKPVVSVTECEEIAKRLSMTTPVREALWFFHHNIGSLMHYPDIPSMKNVVICDCQVVFDSTSELIIDTFRVSNRDIPQSAVKDFREKGQFSLEHIKDRTERHRKNQLSLEQLVDLLKSHNILAEIKSDQESSEQLIPNEESSAQGNQYQFKFVMPAVLKDASEEELKLEDSNQEAVPLMIRFDGGFVPFGVFCASVANLIAHQDTLSPRWQLCDDQVLKNKVKFSIDKSFYATLISRPQYFEIRVKRHPRARAKRSLPNICSTVRQTVVQTLETVITKMRYNAHAKMETPTFPTAHSLAFTCCMEESHSDHLMKVDKDESGYFSECLKESIGLDLEEKHLVWFNQTEQDARGTTQSKKLPISSNSDVTRLNDGDHCSIYNKLTIHAAKWRDIGSALGFLEGELDNIQSNPLLLTQSPPKSWLREMLSEWLQWAPGDGRGSTGFATRETLHAALLKVNLGQLAEQFQ